MVVYSIWCVCIYYRDTDHSDFVFYADRLIRLVIEEGLNRLPYTNVVVETPAGVPYEGIAFCRGNCGVSICRSGEAMEQALRQCCRLMKTFSFLQLLSFFFFFNKSSD
ncbi:unnamed protein product [Gongylonema pulchrum]|uniref:Phosphoribosyltransferase domain-containing protein n=1 Tax=Gongylonema pulchrum TaxID=637853 RepID=A0A3P6SRD5_9BILA|nr:unnamed protein product [Gongylonema pulchrum]